MSSRLVPTGALRKKLSIQKGPLEKASFNSELRDSVIFERYAVLSTLVCSNQRELVFFAEKKTTVVHHFANNVN